MCGAKSEAKDGSRRVSSPLVFDVQVTFHVRDICLGVALRRHALNGFADRRIGNDWKNTFFEGRVAPALSLRSQPHSPFFRLLLSALSLFGRSMGKRTYPSFALVITKGLRFFSNSRSLLAFGQVQRQFLYQNPASFALGDSCSATVSAYSMHSRDY